MQLQPPVVLRGQPWPRRHATTVGAGCCREIYLLADYFTAGGRNGPPVRGEVMGLGGPDYRMRRVAVPIYGRSEFSRRAFKRPRWGRGGQSVMFRRRPDCSAVLAMADGRSEADRLWEWVSPEQMNNLHSRLVRHPRSDGCRSRPRVGLFPKITPPRTAPRDSPAYVRSRRARGRVRPDRRTSGSS